jgi:hypothetical protein
MPIKASYCDAFFDACKNDLFCGHGDFFACARVNPDADDAAKTTAENRKKIPRGGEALARRSHHGA